MSKKGKQKPLYEQVKDILNTLQGKNVPSYQGLHAFWLDPDTFQTAYLYGQRLIAPKEDTTTTQTTSCCGSKNTAPPQPTTPSNCCGEDTDANTIQAVPIAPEGIAASPRLSQSDPKDCWPSGGSGGSSTPIETSKRSDRSAIIRGLKGLPPFDGSIFPKLLWDAAYEATPDQIAIIASWIDADCPVEEDKSKDKEKQQIQIKAVQLSNLKASLARGESLHTVSTEKTNFNTQRCKDLHVRKEVSSLTKEELDTLREAINCMYQYNNFLQDERSYDHWARIHTDSCQHGWEQFLPWHRLYLYFFEQTLQDYDPSITLPYWSWTDYSDVNRTSFNNLQPDLGVLPEAYGCYLTQKGLDTLKDDPNANLNTKEIAALEKIVKKGTIYNSGIRFLKAAGIPYEIINLNGVATWSNKIRAIYRVLRKTNPLWFPNRWPGAMMSPTQYPTPGDIDNLLALDNWSDFGGGPTYDHHFGALEKVHNGMHNFSGGTNPFFPNPNATFASAKEWVAVYEKLGLNPPNPQSIENPPFGWMTDNRITAFDPIFWAHHSNVDRLWAKWQERHNGTPQQMNGALAPWSLTVQDTMSIQQLGYTYMRDTVFYDVHNDVGLQKFNSDKKTFSSNTLDLHRKAEIKIHRVRRGNLHNVYIRIFINTPEASVDTPTLNNPNFVEELSTFHGTCYGGPGHCDLPLSKTRANDLRPLHHHEPRNYKIDATAAVARVLNAGAKDITIQLVVIGIDGQAVDNALYIDGVSLTFFD
ncbi:tyrosinase family protein [Aquimarina rhabdastrellae]